MSNYENNVNEQVDQILERMASGTKPGYSHNDQLLVQAAIGDAQVQMLGLIAKSLARIAGAVEQDGAANFPNVLNVSNLGR